MKGVLEKSSSIHLVLNGSLVQKDVSLNERCDSVYLNHLYAFLYRWTLIE